MALASGYLVDISGIEFDETDNNGTWIQAMPLGKYHHPIHGEIDINPDRIQRFVDNIKNNVRGQDLNIDYDHNEGVAAGWVKDAENRGADGLWLNVGWTQPALQKLKDKEYRYFSPEFNDEWTDPRTKEVHKDVIFGGGITNRPFLKGILPINLSEVLANVTASDQSSNEGGNTMALTPERLKAYAAKLGLGADATEDDVFAELDSLDIVDAAPEPAQLTEGLSPDVIKLAETNPAIAAMVEGQRQLNERLAQTETALRLSEVSGTVKKLNEAANAKGFSIPIPTREKIEASLLAMPKQLSETYVSGIEAILDAKLVQLGEKGFARKTEDGSTVSATDTFNTKTKALTEGGMSFADAVTQVAQQDAELYAAYRKESYSFGGGE